MLNHHRPQGLMRLASLLSALFVVTIAASQPAQKHLPMKTGTWKMNLPKSPKPGDIAEEVTFTEKTGANTFHTTETVVTTSGQKTTLDYMQICDGKEHKTGDSLSHDPELTEICDPETNVATRERAGKVIGQGYCDAMNTEETEMKCTGKFISRKGKEIERIVVYDLVR